AKDAALIATWIDKKQGMPYRFKDIPFEFELIYQASRENFSIDKFHESCDDKGPTVVIIKVRNSNEIIGGYNPLYWYENDLMRRNRSNIFNNSNNYKFKKTSKSFIFSLSNGKIPRLSRVSSPKEAIAWCVSKGPCFGFQDLWIGSNSGISKHHSYEMGIIDKETFEIEEYEVFQIIYKKISFGIIFNRLCKFIMSMFKNTFGFIISIPYNIFGFIMSMFTNILGFIMSVFNNILGFIMSMFKNVFEFIMSIFEFIMALFGEVSGLIMFWCTFLIISSLATLIFIFIRVNDIVRLFTISSSATASIFFISFLITIMKEDNEDIITKSYIIFLCFSFYSFAILDLINNSVLTQILATSSFIAAIVFIFIWHVVMPVYKKLSGTSRFLLFWITSSVLVQNLAASSFVVAKGFALLLCIFKMRSERVNDIVKLFTISYSATASIAHFFDLILNEDNADHRAYIITLCCFILFFHSFAILDFISSSILTQILAVSSFIAAILFTFIYSTRIWQFIVSIFRGIVSDIVKLITVLSSTTASVSLIPILIITMKEDFKDTSFIVNIIFLYFFILSFHTFAIFDFISSSVLVQNLAASSFVVAKVATLIFIFIRVSDIVKLFTISYSATASIVYFLFLIIEEFNEFNANHRAYIITLCCFILSFHSFAILDFISSSILTQILAASSFIAAIAFIFIWHVVMPVYKKAFGTSIIVLFWITFTIISSIATLVFIFIRVSNIVKLITVLSSVTASVSLIPILIITMNVDIKDMIFKLLYSYGVFGVFANNDITNKVGPSLCWK
ncbi:25096_t:CDS:2, partial [Gigaspora rosea]